MTEQPNAARQPAGEKEPPAGGDDDSGSRGRVRTQGETAVDEEMGSGDSS